MVSKVKNLHKTGSKKGWGNIFGKKYFYVLVNVILFGISASNSKVYNWNCFQK